MPITGGIKFFGESQFVYGAANVTITASSGDAIASMALDKNPSTSWRSVSSTDLTTETLTLSFPSATFDRLLFRNINWKDFNVQYLSSGIWTHFAGVVGLDGSKTNITETAFADESGYYEFNEVTTTGLRIQILKTQVANEQKYCFQILGFTELFTLLGYPDISPWGLKRNQRSKKLISGKTLIIKSEKAFEVKMGFQGYPASYDDDLDGMFQLFNREEPFHVWLCGGRRGTTYFKYTPEGMRLQDIYLVQVDSDFAPGFRNNLYKGQVDLGNIVLREHGGYSPDTEEEVTAPVYGNRFPLTNSMAATAFLTVDKADFRQVIVTFYAYRQTYAGHGTCVLMYQPGSATWVLVGPTWDEETSVGVTLSLSTTVAGVASLKAATDGSDGAGEIVYDLEYTDAP